MTRPSEIKPREDEAPGAKFAEWEVGAPLREMRFEITPDICADYALAVGGDPEGYEVEGRRAALPTVLAVYLLAVLYRKYHPQQGGILIDQKFNFFHPIWADETTPLVAVGRVEEKFDKRGRKFIRWSAEFTNPAGQRIATAVNTIAFAEKEGGSP